MRWRVCSALLDRVSVDAPKRLGNCWRLSGRLAFGGRLAFHARGRASQIQYRAGASRASLVEYPTQSLANLQAVRGVFTQQHSRRFVFGMARADLSTVCTDCCVVCACNFSWMAVAFHSAYPVAFADKRARVESCESKSKLSGELCSQFRATVPDYSYPCVA